MAKLGINTGSAPDAGDGDSILQGAVKIISNFDEVYTLLGDGTTLAPGIVTSIVAGTNITLSGSGTGEVTINSSGGGGSSTLDGLTDVTISNLQTNEILKYIGSAWVNDTDATGSGGATDLNGLTDVTITTPSSGQVLKYDGSNWVNDTDATGGGGGGGGTGYFSTDQTNTGIHTTASNVGLGTTNPITSVQVNDVYGIETGVGSFTATAGVAYTANTYTASDFANSEYTLFFQHSSGIQSQKVLIMDDGATAYSQEYAIMHSSDLLVSIGATVDSGNVELWITPETGVNGNVTYRYIRETII